MTERVPADKIEGIVGLERHQTRHYARAVSTEQQVYILHSWACKVHRGEFLEQCMFSVALDNGILPADWEGFEDRPVRVTIGRDRHLIPVSDDGITQEQFDRVMGR